MSSKKNNTLNSSSQMEPGRHSTGVKLAKFVIYGNNDILAIESLILVGLAMFVYFRFDWISQIELMPTFLIMATVFGIILFVVTTLKVNYILKKKPQLILLFSILSAVLMSLDFGLGIYLMNNTQMVREYIVNEVDKFYNYNEEFRQMWKEHVEDELQCCGVKKRNFLDMLLSCPTKMRACADVIEPLLYVYLNTELLRILFWGCAIFQLCDFMLSIYVFVCYSYIFKYHQVPVV
ncbi:uncharacterized protein LOC129566155 [Sitodiplosis mosellana]|uniref:uncharacterized protein LOC129566155 n=1 Tax=Sitodiplosis mosellana TaxID=263140 RepID=UPI0024449B2D|nr:uncharacterized protein LOC129566155 [Sitodiplosis mosellana]